MDLTEALLIVDTALLVLFLLLFRVFLRALLAIWSQVEPLVKRFSQPGGGFPKFSLGQVAGAVGMKLVESVDFSKVLGGLAK